MMKLIIIITIMIMTYATNSSALDCDKHPIYCQIKKNKPKMKQKDAMMLSNLFYKSAKKYKNKNPILSVAIAMQETSLRLDLSRRQNVILFSDDNKSWKVVRGYSDICMFQFHVNTIVHEKIDPIRLKTEPSYCVDQHFKLIKKKLKVCRHLKNEAWTCYHSKTYKLRKRYKEDVERYL